MLEGLGTPFRRTLRRVRNACWKSKPVRAPRVKLARKPPASKSLSSGLPVHVTGKPVAASQAVPAAFSCGVTTHP
jgi:hypothetical protein